MNLFVNVKDAKTITGVSLSNDALKMAQHVLTMLINRTDAASGDMSKRDLHWLKLAVAYQAAYMDSHPEIMELMDVQSVGQGPESVTFRDSGRVLVAPLARMALNKLSWLGSRSLAVRNGFKESVNKTSDEGWERI